MATTKYQRIKEELLAEITGKEPGTPLPNERELADQFDVSRTTVRQALKALSNDGRIYAVRGRGTFVSSQRVSKSEKLTSFSEDMQSRGLAPGTRVIDSTLVPADAEVANALEVAPGTEIYHLERLRLAAGVPMCFEQIWLPSVQFPGLLSQDLERPLYGILASLYNTTVERGDQTISATLLDHDTSDLLGLEYPSAALLVTRRSYNARGRVIEYGRSYYRSDRYDFNITVNR